MCNLIFKYFRPWCTTLALWISKRCTTCAAAHSTVPFVVRRFARTWTAIPRKATKSRRKRLTGQRTANSGRFGWRIWLENPRDWQWIGDLTTRQNRHFMTKKVNNYKATCTPAVRLNTCHVFLFTSLPKLQWFGGDFDDHQMNQIGWSFGNCLAMGHVTPSGAYKCFLKPSFLFSFRSSTVTLFPLFQRTSHLPIFTPKHDPVR